MTEEKDLRNFEIYVIYIIACMHRVWRNKKWETFQHSKFQQEHHSTGLWNLNLPRPHLFSPSEAGRKSWLRQQLTLIKYRAPVEMDLNSNKYWYKFSTNKQGCVKVVLD